VTRRHRDTEIQGQSPRHPLSAPPRRNDPQPSTFGAALTSALSSRIFGCRVHYFDEIDSTNLYALRLAREGAEEGEVVVADGQTQGRGRLGRSFFSPQGVNLYVSIILRPQIPARQVPQLTLVAGVAVAETVESFSGLKPSLKWPNDTLLNGRKVSGILTEMETQGSRVSLVVSGIGVNLNCPREVFPEELRGKATSVFIETGQKVDRAAFAAELLGRLAEHYFLFLRQGLATVRCLWENYSDLTGKRVVVDKAGRRVEGQAIGLDEDGALVLEGEEGERLRVLAGEVTVVES